MSIVIVIDPGHGSLEYLGGEAYPYIEKDLNLTVALYMKQQLEKFDDVKVILTRSDDSAVELKERCDIAAANGADYFVSIHFNMSVDHDLYGTEVWISSKKDMYNAMYPFAKLINADLNAQGLYNRGIKTRLGSSGDDYYAVIRHNTENGIPSCIIEHCYLDNENDFSILGTPGTAAYEEKLKEFGTLDAQAFAKFAHLKSTALGIDYSGYSVETSNRTENIIKPDDTPPSECVLSIAESNIDAATVTFSLSARDDNGWINYYKYSTDNGQTYSKNIIFPKNTESVSFSISNLKEDDVVIAQVANGYDLWTESNHLPVAFEKEEVDEEITDRDEDVREIVWEDRANAKYLNGKSENDDGGELEFETVSVSDYSGVQMDEKNEVFSDTTYFIFFVIILFLFFCYILTSVFAFKRKKRKIRRRKIKNTDIVKDDFEEADDEIG